MYTQHFKTLLCGFLPALCGMFVGQPAQATDVNRGVSTITYNDGVRKIYTFASGTDGNLYTNYWNGSGWHWANMGNPGVTIYSVSAITFRSNGVQQIYVFAGGSDYSLYAEVWNGSSWAWRSLGHPAVENVLDPIAMTYFDGKAQQIRVACSGTFFGLYLLSMQGNSASSSWRTLGNGDTFGQTAVAYTYGGIHYFDVFASDTSINPTGDIYRDAWHGYSGSTWTDQSHPSGLGGIIGMSAVTYPTSGAPYIYNFTTSQYTNDLYVDYGTGTFWQWADQGNPGVGVSSPSALTVGSNLYAFCAGSNGNLYVNYWNGAWHWADQGHPSTTYDVVPSPSSSIAYNDGVQRIYVFGVGANGDLCVNYWNGSSWQWADQGHP